MEDEVNIAVQLHLGGILIESFIELEDLIIGVIVNTIGGHRLDGEGRDGITLVFEGSSDCRQLIKSSSNIIIIEGA